MGLDDFEACTPFEFQAIFREWQKMKESEMKRSWEQARFLALASIQPHSKKTLKPTDIMRFDWDKPSMEKRGESSSYERMKRVAERLNKKKSTI